MKEEYVQKLSDTLTELKEIRKWINADRNKFDSKAKYLISYSVIKASGSIEVIFKNIIYDVLSDGAKEEARQYLEKVILDSSCNPSAGNMSNILQNISSDWKTKFDDEVKKGGIKDKINSLVQLRNDFAHGDNIRVSIDTVIQYYEAAQKVLKILDSIVSK